MKDGISQYGLDGLADRYEKAKTVNSDEEFQKLYLEIKENIERIEKKIKNITEHGNEYNDYNKRLSHIREALQGGVMEEAAVRVMLQNIDRIVVHMDKKLELQFPKHR